MIVASEKAELGQPEILLGIIPGGGGTQRLARVIGKQRAMELVLTGRRISALEGYEMGLVNKVSKSKEWLTDALELAAVVARRPPIAARLAKQAVLGRRRDHAERRAGARAPPVRARPWPPRTGARACGPSSRSASRSSAAGERRGAEHARRGRGRDDGSRHRPAGLRGRHAGRAARPAARGARGRGRARARAGSSAGSRRAGSRRTRSASSSRPTRSRASPAASS